MQELLMRKVFGSVRKKLSSVWSTSLLALAALLVLIGVLPMFASAQANTHARFPKHSNTVLHIKFKDNADVTLAGNTFVGQGAGDVNTVLSQSKAQSKQQLFRDTSTNLKAQYKALKANGAQVSDLSQYYEIKIPSNADIQAVSDHLRSLPYVEDAYPQPLPAPAPTTPNFTSQELFRAAAPQGVSASFAYNWPGGFGGHVKVVDLEYSWNTNHEDLSKARASGALIANGTPVDPFNDNNHGTAVLGILSGDNNSFGVTGLVPNAALNMVNTSNAESGWDVANAVYTAVNHMVAGDVMIIEQQTWGPSTDANAFVPVEWIPEVYDAITYAEAKNITVVEAGGNGSQNLDDASLYGTSFPAGKPDSGAIIVGAGAACSGSAPARSRLGFSDYGTRVNLQGLGECVTTTGYGDLSNGGTNALYTNYFNGTSSATPIVAGAAASFASAYKTLNGVAPSSALVRSTLYSTGTAQNFASGSLSGIIGPLPNLGSALLATDLKAPTVPVNLAATLSSNRNVVLNWGAATDNVGVANYIIYRNDVVLKTVTAPSTTFTDTTVTPKKTYQYKIVAVDKAGRVSAFSNAVSITIANK